jgi:arsenate reductase (thioredoxin)
MKEAGIDIAGKKTQSVYDLYRLGRNYDYVITVCDESQSGRCPVFPGSAVRVHWGFRDPSGFTGSADEKAQSTREVRDEIESQVKLWLAAL